MARARGVKKKPAVFLFPRTAWGEGQTISGLRTLGVMKIAEGLLRDGIDADYPLYFHKKREIADVFERGSYDIVGFSTYLPVMSSLRSDANAIREMCRLAKRFIKRNPCGLVVLGGHGSHHNTRTFLMNSPAHVVAKGVYGEAVGTMRELVAGYDKSWVKSGRITPAGHRALSRIRGVAYKYGEGVLETKSRMPPKALPALSWDVARLDVPPIETGKDGVHEAVIGIQITRAGCEFALGRRCSYCTMGAELERIREELGPEAIRRIADEASGIETAIMEVKNAVAGRKALEERVVHAPIGRFKLVLSDDNNSYRKFSAFLERVKRETGLAKREIWVKLLTRPEMMTPEFIRYLQEQTREGIGIEVKMGVEFGSQRDLEFTNRHYTFEDAARKVGRMRKAGIDVATFHILTTPASTLEDFRKNLLAFKTLSSKEDRSLSPALYKWGRTFPSLDAMRIGFVANGRRWEFDSALRPVISDSELERLADGVKKEITLAEADEFTRRSLRRLLAIIRKERRLRTKHWLFGAAFS